MPDLIDETEKETHARINKAYKTCNILSFVGVCIILLSLVSEFIEGGGNWFQRNGALLTLLMGWAQNSLAIIEGEVNPHGVITLDQL